MTDQPRKPKHRWFQFSLRTLLIAVTLAAGVLVAWRVYVEPYRRQRETMALIEELGCMYAAEPGGPKWMRNWFGADNFQDITFVDVADCDDPQAYLEQVAALPRMETLVVGGRDFDDEELGRLRGLDTLRGLILDSTSVTDEGIASLKETLPDLVVHKSRRRSTAAIQGWGGWIRTKPNVVHLRFRRPDLKKYFQYLTGIHAGNVSDVGLAHLKGLTKLEWLDIDGTQVSEAGLAHLKGLTNLRRLELKYTQVSEAGLAHLKGMTKLKWLDLEGTRVSEAGLAHLKGLTNLGRLDLEGTQVTDAGLAHLKGMTNLQTLILTGTQVSDAGLAHLKGLTELRRLYLEGTRVGDAGLAHLKGMTELEWLYLEGTQVTDAGLAHLKGMTKLKWLFLHITQVSDSGLTHLKGLTKLEWLSLGVTQVSEAGFRDIQKALPNCLIRH